MQPWMKFTLVLIAAPVWLPLLACAGLLMVTGLSALLMSVM